jgi:aminoglycoside phosphotransferase (APT) family kinase protein
MMCRRERSTVRKQGGRRSTARALARGHHAVVVREKRHGLDDHAETRALLRSPPTRQALTWVADCVGDDVVEWKVLRGGTSSAMYALTVGVQARAHLVLRCYVRADLNEEDPDLAGREAAALGVMAAADVPTPRLVAVDPRGERVGVPAVLMTRLPGRVVWDPRAVDRWLRRLAAVLPTVHDAAVGEDDSVGQYFNYEQLSYEPPRWATTSKVWERAVEVFHGPILEDDRAFIHRDYHPGNVLWNRADVAGVVDWQSACVGPPSVDIGHCRANFLLYAPELADRFTAAAERALGRRFHPWADVAALIGMLDGLRRTPPRPAGCLAVENALLRATSEF